MVTETGLVVPVASPAFQVIKDPARRRGSSQLHHISFVIRSFVRFFATVP